MFAANLVLLSNDVALNPGSVIVHNHITRFQVSLTRDFLSQDSELLNSFRSLNGDSSSSNSDKDAIFTRTLSFGLETPLNFGLA